MWPIWNLCVLLGAALSSVWAAIAAESPPFPLSERCQPSDKAERVTQNESGLEWSTASDRNADFIDRIFKKFKSPVPTNLKFPHLQLLYSRSSDRLIIDFQNILQVNTNLFLDMLCEKVDDNLLNICHFLCVLNSQHLWKQFECFTFITQLFYSEPSTALSL